MRTVAARHAPATAPEGWAWGRVGSVETVVQIADRGQHIELSIYPTTVVGPSTGSHVELCAGTKTVKVPVRVIAWLLARNDGVWQEVLEARGAGD
jgi:hypothetical protein